MKKMRKRHKHTIRKVSLGELSRNACFIYVFFHTMCFEVKLEDESLADGSKHFQSIWNWK